MLTGKDLAADDIGEFPIGPGLKRADGKPMTAPPYYPLAVDEARFVGEAVAAVIAQTRAQAEDAAEQVAVDYEELPAGDDDGGGSSRPVHRRSGPTPRATSRPRPSSATRKPATMRSRAPSTSPKCACVNQRLIPVTMEPRGSIGEFDAASGRYTLHTSCQNPAGLQKTLAEAILKVPMDKVRVRVYDVGGGFGMKTMLYPEDACARTPRASSAARCIGARPAARNSSPARTAAIR